MNQHDLNAGTDLSGRVAVITGGASGIGFAIAKHAASAGMKVALADIEEGALDKAVCLIKETGVEAIGVRTDVASLDSVRALEQKVAGELGAPWLVVNNAGVAKLGLSWELSEADWRWVLDVNLYGVVNGLQAFLPGLVLRNSGYVINTASAAGLMGVPGGAPYVASKHAVVGLSESVYRELRAVQSSVGISVLCPAAVDTRIAYADRNRPGQPHYEAPTEGLPPIPLDEPLHVLPSDEVAAQVFSAISSRRFWVLPHVGVIGTAVITRAHQMVESTNPDKFSVDRESALVHSLMTGVNFVE